MKGIFKKAKALGMLAAGALAASGCVETYNELVDPCWPQRWNCRTREEVNYHLDTQANNGLVLEQTVWNTHFREGSDELTPGGMALLDRLVRRRPQPVKELFLQTAHDVRYLVEKPSDFGPARTDLDARRVKAVETYLAQVRPGVTFQVTVHDPDRVGMSAVESSKAVVDHVNAAAGTMTGGAGGMGGGGSTGGGGRSGGGTSGGSSR